MTSTAAKKCLSPAVRYSDVLAERWLWSGAPLHWHDKVDLTFEEVGIFDLEPASSLKHWDVLAFWTSMLARRRAVPPIIVSRTAQGTYYIHDGNHRYEAIKICFRNRLAKLRVRVAVVVPRPGYRFTYRWFQNYGTHVLEADPRLVRAASPSRPHLHKEFVEAYQNQLLPGFTVDVAQEFEQGLKS